MIGGYITIDGVKYPCVPLTGTDHKGHYVPDYIDPANRETVVIKTVIGVIGQ